MKITVKIHPESQAETALVGDLLKSLAQVPLEDKIQVKLQPIIKETAPPPAKVQAPIKPPVTDTPPAKVQTPVTDAPPAPPAAVVTDTPVEGELTLETLRAKTAEVVSMEEGKYKLKLRDILTSYGAKNASTVPVDKRQEYYEKLLKIKEE